jgi:hypothetical protein
MKYRIVTNGEECRLQYKFLGCIWMTSTSKFASPKDVQHMIDYLENLDKKPNNNWQVVEPEK